MTLDEILEEWRIDSKIDEAILDKTSLDISHLHYKYEKIYRSERLLLHMLEADFKKLKLEKYEFFLSGPSRETEEKGWEYPHGLKILKTDIPMYMEADKEITAITLKILYAKEKIECLASIIQSLSRRTYQIQNAITWKKWLDGN